MEALTKVFDAYEEGWPALLLSGRSLHDIDVDSDGKLRTLIEALRRSCRERYGMQLLTYSIAEGLDWDESRIADERDRQTVRRVLAAHELLEIPQDHEVPRVVRGVSSLLRTPTNGLQWADGRRPLFGCLFLFADHFLPGCLANGTQTDAQLVASELAYLVSQSLALRASQNLVLFHGRDGLIDELVTGGLYHVRLTQPAREGKECFLRSAMTLHGGATFEEGLTPESVAHLTTNTPNRGLEALLRMSNRTGRAVTAKELAEQKNRDVEEMSERTLTVLDTTDVRELELTGLNVVVPQRILDRYATGLAEGNRLIPANILLAGPPGVGKTVLAKITANRARAAAYEMHSPKGSLVGETERKARLQQKVLEDWSPNIAFVDEVTEAFPLERSEYDLDSGATRAVTAALLSALSNEGRRGMSLLIATTNCPWRMGAAMRSRFTIVPVLHPLREDFPGIIVTIAAQLVADGEIRPEDPAVQEAAEIFYSKGATPRHIRASLSEGTLQRGALTPDSVLFAARNFCESTDLGSIIYADLWATKLTSYQSFLPWSSDTAAYPFPPHLGEVVDKTTGAVNQKELERRIQELRPHANV